MARLGERGRSSNPHGYHTARAGCDWSYGWSSWCGAQPYSLAELPVAGRVLRLFLCFFLKHKGLDFPSQPEGWGGRL